jgi:hypothetical protein
MRFKNKKILAVIILGLVISAVITISLHHHDNILDYDNSCPICKIISNIISYSVDSISKIINPKILIERIIVFNYSDYKSNGNAFDYSLRSPPII